MPLNVFVPFNVTKPPLLTVFNPKAPLMMPVRINLLLWLWYPIVLLPVSVILLVIVRVAEVAAELRILPPKVMLPPESVIFPVADPKRVYPMLTSPDTVIVPTARPLVEVPKFRMLLPVVTEVPSVASAPPVEFVDQKVLPSELKVPPAVPKPVVVPLLSHQ